MKKILSLSILLPLFACTREAAVLPPVATKPENLVKPVICADTECFIAHDNAKQQWPQAQWKAFFAQAQYRDKIIRIMSRPSTSRPWYIFRTDNVAGGQIAGGSAFLQENRATTNATAAQYGIPAEILVAILGIETHYGKNTGSFRVADALTTLAFSYPARAEFFQSELSEFLLMSRELGRDPFTFSGSYAGAMGMPQFMPSSYRKWAVDNDGDGFADIWHSKADALASVANYLVAHGWQRGGTIRVPVTITPSPDLSRILDEKTSLDHTVGEFRRLGVSVPTNIADNEHAGLYRLETSPGQFSYFLGLNNFYVIWQYNHSRLYVEAVTEIAEGIAAAEAQRETQNL